MTFVAFMASAAGRWIRIVAGVVLVVVGWRMQSGAGTVLALIGFVPLLAGVFDLCVLAPLFGYPMGGTAIRKRL